MWKSGTSRPQTSSNGASENHIISIVGDNTIKFKIQNFYEELQIHRHVKTASDAVATKLFLKVIAC